MANTDKLQKLLNNLTKINCPMLECKYCFINEENDDWPDCEKPTTIKDGYLKCLGFKEITCPFFESR